MLSRPNCKSMLNAAALGVMLAALAPSARPAHAGVLWNELTQGDLSDDRLAPSAFTLTPDDNFLFGVLSGADGMGAFDRDYYSVTIPAGHVLSQIVLGAYISVDFAAFMAIEPGAVYPIEPDSATPGDLFGWTHFGPADELQDLLPLLGANGLGFIPPLPEGTYSFWVQQTDDFTNYDLNFVVEEVPAPASGALMIGGFVTLSRRKRRES